MPTVTYPEDLRDATMSRTDRRPISGAGARGGQAQLRFVTCGSVDDGKSTLMGRLLFEAGAVASDQLSKLRRDSRTFGTAGDDLDYALLFDGLEDERAQGITIDVSYRYFETARRAFVVADAPGHESYTRNMATAASTSEVAVLLVDARKGVLTQTRRHAVICSLVGVRSFVLAVNKFDLVGYDRAVFDRIVGDFASFAARLRIQAVAAIPLSARRGDNVVAAGGNTPWYQGPTLVEHLEAVEEVGASVDRPFRFVTRWVSRPDSDFRGYAGTVSSGSVRVGMRVGLSGAQRQGTVRRLLTPAGEVAEAAAGEAATIVFDEHLDVARGDVLHAPEQPPSLADQFQAHVLWMSDEPLLPGRQYLLRLGSRHVLASLTAIRYALDVNTLEHLAAEQLSLNDIAVCNLTTAVPIAFDAFADNRETGAFILIDRTSHATAAAGMIDFALARAGNLHPQRLTVDKAARTRLTRHRPVIVWFTGLSGAGKSTIADLVERALHARGHMTYLLDGDNIRRGLNRDLGFTTADRVENIRRVGEVARLFVDAGLIVLCAFISPFAAERQLVREMVEDGEFLEVFVDAEIETCMARDPKGLYAKARRGGIRNFTGFDSPYERPTNPELRIETNRLTPDEAAQRTLDLLRSWGVIRDP